MFGDFRSRAGCSFVPKLYSVFSVFVPGFPNLSLENACAKKKHLLVFIFRFCRLLRCHGLHGQFQF